LLSGYNLFIFTIIIRIVIVIIREGIKLPEKIYTTYQISRFCQVNIRTVIRWIETGKLKAYTTPGGHRRVKWGDLITFLNYNRMPIPGELETAKKKKVLIIDQNTDFYEKVSKLLSELQDVEIKKAASGFDAGMIVAEWLPNLIIMNFIILDLNCFEITKLIRGNPRIKKIPIIAVSSNADPIELEKIKNCGVDALVKKPIEKKSFIKKVKRLLFTQS